MHVQPQLVLLQKTLLNIEGLGRQLYPDLDLWQTAKPFLERWFQERLSPKAKIKKLIKQLPDFADQFLKFRHYFIKHSIMPLMLKGAQQYNNTNLRCYVNKCPSNNAVNCGRF